MVNNHLAKKTFLSLAFLPLVISNFDSADVETVIRNEVSGPNASAHTEITNIINGKEVKVESDQPGEIRVEVKNGEVNVESSPEVSPTIVISELSEEEVEKTEEETTEQVGNLKNQIYSFITELFSRLSRFFRIRS